MKKLFALILCAAMILSLAACGETPAQSTSDTSTAAAGTTEEKTTEATTPEATETEETTTAASGTATAGTLYVVNALAAGKDEFKDPLETRYNAYWLNGYSLSDFVEKNFWWAPADEEKVHILSFADLYEYGEEMDFGKLKEQGLTLDVPEELQKNYAEGLLIGTGIAKSQFPYHFGYILAGPEAIIVMCEDGYVAKDLFTDLEMADAEAYDFICADGYLETIDKAELENVELFFNDGRVDCTSIAYPSDTLHDILYIVPTGMTKESEAPSGVSKITVFNTAIADMDADMYSVFGGTVQSGIAVKDLVEGLELEKTDAVKCISYLDGASGTQAYDDFMNRYMILTDSKDRGAYVIGKGQTYGEAILNSAYFVIGQDTLVYVPASATKDEGALNIGDALTACGYTDVAGVKVICEDGYSEEIDAADLAGLTIFHNEDRIDTTSVAYPDQTLQSVVKIEVIK